MASPKPERPKLSSTRVVTKAASTGDRRATLEAMRQSLAAAMDDCETNVIAQIAGRLSAVMLELENLPVKEKSTSDDLAARRASRRAKAAVAAPAKRRGKQLGG